MKLSVEIPEELHGHRLDQALAALLSDYSRARLQKWIKQGHVLVNGEVRRPRDTVMAGQVIAIEVPEETVHSEENGQCEPQDIPVSVLYEDKDLIIVDKPVGLVVHPAAGNPDGTLQNALLFHFPELTSIPRAGIVHRLDKDTSGVMVVARSLRAHTSLVKQLQTREMGREYEAVVNGVMISGGTVDEPIGRHPVDRKRMAVVRNGKPAITHYRVLQKFTSHTHIRLKLESGRTHQIRVHMAYIRYPIVGDSVYGGRLKIPAGATDELIETLRSFPRQALHAARLELVHPESGETMFWESPLPEDMQNLLSVLEKHTDG